MIAASDDFKRVLRKGANVVNYATITFRDGTSLELTPANFMVHGCTIEDATTDSGFGIGYAIGKTVTISLSNHEDQFSAYDFYKATFVLYCGLQIGEVVEKIRKGTYYVAEPETPGEIIQFSGVDAMHLFDQPYETTLSYPATLQNILSDCCTKCGVEIGFGQFDHYDLQVSTKPTDCSFREVVAWVAGAAGYNARINNFGALELVYWSNAVSDVVDVDGRTFSSYTDHDYILDGGSFTDYTQQTVYDGGTFNDINSRITEIKSLTMGTDVITITGVKVRNDDTEVLEGTDDYIIELVDNPLTAGKEAEIALYLYNKLSTLEFRTMSAQILCNPLYEPFDAVILMDRKGRLYSNIINSVSYNNGSYTTIQCIADPPIRTESYYVSEGAKAVVRARKETKEAISSYDLVVQNMNRIASNALGYFMTYQEQIDGSRITFIHNKPTLSASSTIYKITSDGFFVSTDGGQTYTAGFDSQGNAVVNILSAIGINFDWAHGGTLTLGGLDNVSGSLRVLNAQGVQIGKIDKDGFDMKVAWSDVTGTSDVETKSNASATYETKTDASTAYGGLQSQITQNADNILLKVSKGDVSSEISQEAGQISISTNRISISSTYFTLSADGSLTASNATLNGTLTTVSSPLKAVFSSGELKFYYINEDETETLTGGISAAYVSNAYNTTFYGTGGVALAVKDVSQGTSATVAYWSPSKAYTFNASSVVYLATSTATYTFNNTLSISATSNASIGSTSGSLSLSGHNGITLTASANANISLTSGNYGNITLTTGASASLSLISPNVKLGTSTTATLLTVSSNSVSIGGSNNSIAVSITAGSNGSISLSNTVASIGSSTTTVGISGGTTNIQGSTVSIYGSSTLKLGNNSSTALTLSTGTSNTTKFTFYRDGQLEVYNNYSLFLCTSTNQKLGFFGTSTSSTRKTVSKITNTSTATAATCATKINDLLDALKAYNLITT